MKASLPQNPNSQNPNSQNASQPANISQPANAGAGSQLSGKISDEQTLEQMQNIKMRANKISSDIDKPVKKSDKSAMAKGFGASANIFFEIAAGGITGLFLAYMSSYFLHTGIGVYLLLGVFGLFGGLYGAFKKISSENGFVVKNVDNSNANDTDEDELKVWKQ